MPQVSGQQVFTEQLSLDDIYITFSQLPNLFIETCIVKTPKMSHNVTALSALHN